MTTKLIPGAVFLLTFLLPCRAAEPRYAGKPLAFWLDELKSDDPLIREEALAVLSEAGAAARAATPAILKLTHHPEVSLRAASLTALRFVADPMKARRAVVQALEDEEDPLVRCRAVVLLRQLAPKHPDILLHVHELLKQPVGRIEVLSLVGQMGPEAARAVPTLTKLLTETDPPARRLAIRALGRIGPAARPAVPALLEQLGDADVLTEHEMVIALRAIGGDSARIVPAVLEAAKQHGAGRSDFMLLLADYGSQSAAAVPWLVAELRRQPSSPVTVLIAETLYKIDPKCARKEARPLLRKMLPSSNPWRVSAAATLRRLEPDNDEALQTLIDCVSAGSREPACNVLGQLGKSAGKAAPALRKAMGDAPLSVRVSAAVALWQITGETDSTAPVLLEALKPSPNNYNRPYAAYYLGQMGTALNKAALPELRKFRDDAEPVVREGVRRAIEQLESSATTTKSPEGNKPSGR